jgi:aminopeptidase
MRLQLERIRHQLIQLKEEHEPMEAVIEQLLKEYSDALQPPVRRQVNFIHKAQRLIKVSICKAYEKPELLKKVLSASDPCWSMMPELKVDKELVKNLAKQLFESSGAQAEERIIIATTEDGRDVTEEVITHCLRNGVDFELGIKDPLRMTYLINELDEEGLRRLTELNMSKYEDVTREIIISSSTDPAIKKMMDQEKMKTYKKMNQAIHDKAMSGALHYTLTRIPTQYDAELDEMNYEEYLRLFFELCDQPWEEIEIAQQKLIERFNPANEVQITNADGTDLRLDITGQTFANSVIAKNIPGSEIFSSPLRKGVNGTLVSVGHFRYGNSGLIKDITLEFVDGRVESLDARVNKEGLEKIISKDDGQGEGTRHVGELGIGTNPHLRQHVINSLLVEKIGGSFHLALGSCYTYDNYLGTPVQLSNGNQSASGVHWDMTTMLRGKEGKMSIDGELIQDNGEWVGEEYAVLNEGWNAVDEAKRPEWWKERYPNGYKEL